MKKIDMRRHYFIVLDTETCNGFIDEKGKQELRYSLAYDCGFAVVDKWGTVYESHSYVIEEIFRGERELMQSAYYANKLPQYWEQIWSGERKMVTIYQLRNILREVMEKYHVTEVCAHNAQFDVRALNNTIRYITKSQTRYFFPFGTVIWDSMKMAHSVVANTPTYIRFCESNGYMTNHRTPRPRETAEVLYRYITKDIDFVEKHTGLEDVLIEKEIVRYCFAKHKRMVKLLYA